MDAQTLLDDPACRDYLQLLALDLVAHGGLNGQDLTQAITAAHERRQAFLLEIQLGQTERAQLARAELCKAVYHEARAKRAQG